MTDLRFDGRVAIVTGAGGNPGLGRSYAHLLASRGARVLVNDLGVGPDGKGLVKADAAVVAKEIVDAGGEAISDVNSVAEEASAKRVVQAALDEWGRVDILVNNAGVVILAQFDEISSTDIERVLRVHVFGTVWMTRAVWPVMKAAGYGRIVNTSSSTFLGVRYATIYGMAKGAIMALTRGLSIEGADFGIRVNTIGPGAGTAAMAHLTHLVGPPPDLVAPVVAFLAHESCPTTGGYFQSSAGKTVYRYFAQSHGYLNPDASIEDIRDNFATIQDPTDLLAVPEPMDNPLAHSIEPKPYVDRA